MMSPGLIFGAYRAADRARSIPGGPGANFGARGGPKFDLKFSMLTFCLHLPLATDPVTRGTTILRYGLMAHDLLIPMEGI